MSVEYQIAFTLPPERGRILGVALSRGDRDFSEDERDLLDRSRSFLIQTYRNALRHTEALARAQPASADQLIGLGLTARQAEVLRQWPPASPSATSRHLRSPGGELSFPRPS